MTQAHVCIAGGVLGLKMWQVQMALVQYNYSKIINDAIVTISVISSRSLLECISYTCNILVVNIKGNLCGLHGYTTVCLPGHNIIRNVKPW